MAGRLPPTEAMNLMRGYCRWSSKTGGRDGGRGFDVLRSGMARKSRAVAGMDMKRCIWS